jgi:SAM-dependent methyltransferase
MPTASDLRAPTQSWNADSYARNARYVAEFGGPVMQLLAPRAGERILDLGCGDGFLTEKIVAAGATVVGVDASASMVEAARRRGIDAHVVNAYELAFDREFDAVFSNAALHWMRDADAVIAKIARALKPGGRFVAEMGGHACCAAIVVAIEAVLARRGIDAASVNPWYFPTPDDYSARLRAGGFAIDSIALVPRPTPLASGVKGFLDTFTENFFRPLQADDRAKAIYEVIALLKPVLCDTKGNWSADYTRLRFAAHLAS